MRFVYPEIFWGGLGFLVLLLAVFVWSNWRAKRRMRLFLGPAIQRVANLRAIYARSRLKALLFLLGLLMILIGLARPVLEPEDQEIKRIGMDYFIVLDGSKSMLATDMESNRLEASKRAIKKLLEASKGDRVGLVVFAGKGFLRAPLTFDFAAYNLVLDHVSASNTYPGGTNLEGGLERVADAMADMDLKHKAVIVISDGEELEGDAVGFARQMYNEHGIVTHAVAAGTMTGAKIELSRRGDRVYYQRDAYGTEVTSRMDRSLLRRVAEAGRGKFIELDEDGDALVDLYYESLKPLGDEADVTTMKGYVEFFPIPLLIGLALLLVQTVIPEKNIRHTPRAILTDE
ncbi:vWA domain-containing protein [Cerasicoccus fimbriatus]|uniref:vWA domain-containing protein n=1 Tax=Cerasicoccus fimbriatus TaxID=3014554 RepID=UPI0022B480F7|nr:VWA domain-containing protein [Cerasicoccus sp. TK19100]